MNGKPLSSLTLRELMKEMRVVSREFTAHLQQGFLPKVDSFAQTIQQHLSERRNSPLAARSARNFFQATLDSHRYSRDAFQRFHELIQEIDSRMRELVHSS